ncbi:MAG: bifunctional chorismate mutase/prephenate dehydrogenase [Hydrococcus sp. Prado102]|jgi:prephenate dehydrogenase/chorismate mutase/prephenate dehydrogenase|nr:bifunctional chorismate mutase/prephenate dehydrogenase [Hydrococcus sp. Prado102]
MQQKLKQLTQIESYITPRRVTIVGGGGMMGRLFAKQLSAMGHDITILESNDWQRAEQLLGNADLVLLSVPIEYTVDVVRSAAKYITPTTALADITSIKVPIVDAMLNYHSGPVLGLHPMFGPSVESFSSQNVVVCPGRHSEAFQWLLDLIETKGGKLIFSTPSEHDQIMVVVQAIRQFSTFSFGLFLTNEKIDIDRSWDFSSPSYRQELEKVGRLFAQSAPLIVDIMLATKERREAIAKLATTYNRLALLVMQEDRETLIHELQTAQDFFKKYLYCLHRDFF